MVYRVYLKCGCAGCGLRGKFDVYYAGVKFAGSHAGRCLNSGSDAGSSYVKIIESLGKPKLSTQLNTTIRAATQFLSERLN